MTRFICSQKRSEIEAVKKELFRAGIRSEIRNNPLAEALRVTRLELWLEDERDLFNASKLYAALQESAPAKPPEVIPAAPESPTTSFIEADVPDTTEQPHQDANGAPDPGGEPPADELSQASVLLEKEIEQALERESRLSDTCASLRNQLKELTEKLAQNQTELNRETEERAATERKHTSEISKLQEALEREKQQRRRAEETLEDQTRKAREQLQSRDKALKEAEERASKAMADQKGLGEQLLAQREEQRHAYAESLKNLRSKLQHKELRKPETPDGER